MYSIQFQTVLAEKKASVFDSAVLCPLWLPDYAEWPFLCKHFYDITLCNYYDLENNY